MTCAEVQDLIEAVAAGDVPLAGELAAHVAACRGCAAALEAASEIERALIESPVPAVPARFVQDVLQAVRRERWHYEQRVDRAFNLTIAAGVGVVVVAVVSLLNVGSVAQLLMSAMDALSEVSEPPVWPASVGASRAVVWLATLMVATGLGVWWWAEHRPGYEDGGPQ
jgi:ABC-type uncharacterized transport system permease subunit